MMPHPDLRSLRASLTLLTALVSAVAASAAPAATPPAPTELSRLDLLPQLLDGVRVGMVSSYDRTEGNDDGFSGKYSALRKEGDTLVLAELTGPGAVFRLWTPTPSDDVLEFYFDGETTPRLALPFRNFFDGSSAPFLRPLVGIGSGGYWSYVPITYAKSLKVIARAQQIQFIQMNYATYPAGTAMESFKADAAPPSREALAQARALLERTGQDITRWTAPAGAALQVAASTHTLAPGKSAMLFETKHGGRIVGLRLSPTSALAGSERAIVLKMTWDGAAEPAVLSPAGDFFGFAWGKPSARSLLVGTDGDTCYAYFPMPFEKSARVELVSEKTDGAPVEIHAEIVHATPALQAGEARFHAVWRRENPTERGRPFTYLKTEGRGKVVGVMLQAEGENDGTTGFFEGDDIAHIDGELAIHGTGSEDFFNGGWYDVPGRWEGRASYPLNGCLEYIRPQSRSGGFRLLVTDAYHFSRSIDLAIEHAAEKNNNQTDYAAVTYFYLDRTPSGGWPIPPAAQRKVKEIDRLIFVPGWYQPATTFAIEKSTLTKKSARIGDADVRWLSLRATDADMFGPPHLALFCDVPDAGRYRVSVELLKSPEHGVAQLYYAGIPVGAPLNGRSAQEEKGAPIAVAELPFASGTNRLYFELTAPDGAKGPLELNIARIVLDRIR